MTLVPVALRSLRRRLTSLGMLRALSTPDRSHNKPRISNRALDTVALMNVK